MSTQSAPEPGSPNPYGTPQQPLSKKELKVQKRMQKAARPWVARHKILTGVIAVAGVAAVGSQMGGAEEDTQAATAPAESSAPATQDSGVAAPATEGIAVAEEAVVEEAPAEETGPQIDVPVQVGDLEVTVVGLEPGIASVGDEYFGAQAQGQFVRVDLSLTNTGDAGATFWEDDAVLVDSEGRQHSTSSDSIYLDESESWLLTEINPGNTATGALLFDIPADAEIDLLQVSPGIFSDPVDIRLR